MKRLVRWFSFLVATFFIVWIAWTSPTLNKCLSDQFENYGSIPLQEMITRFYDVLVGSRLCIGDFIHINGEDIIAIFTIILGIATCFLWRATRDLVQDARATGTNQLNIAKIAADAAKGSADASLIALRPWLSCKVEIAGPLVFTKNGDPQFAFKITVKNVGHSPAMGIDIFVFMSFLGQEHSILRLKKHADHNREMPVGTGNEEIGSILFPDDTPQIFCYKIGIDRAAIEKACADISPSTNFFPEVLGIVTYTYPLATVRSDTGFVYMVERIDGAFNLKERVLKKNIRIREHDLWAGFAT